MLPSAALDKGENTMRYRCIKAFTIEKDVTICGRDCVDYTHVEEGSMWKMVSGGGDKVILQRCNNGMEKLETTLGALKKYFERV